MGDHEVLPYSALFEKKIELLLSHIRDKNKLKNRDSFSPLVQCFKTTIGFFWFNVSRLLLISFGSILQDFSSHMHKTLCISIHHFQPLHFYSFIYTCPRPFMPSHLKYTQTKNDVIYLQPFNNIHITPTLSYHLIITCMYRLWPRKGVCIFYSMTIAYGFDVEVGRCVFCVDFVKVVIGF